MSQNMGYRDTQPETNKKKNAPENRPFDPKGK